MSYLYYPAQKASTNYEATLNHPTNMSFLLICYHVNMEGRYPFIQLLLEKSEYKDVFKIPQINILSDVLIEEATTNKVIQMLETFITKKINKEDIIIDGVIAPISKQPILLVNLTNINIFNLEFTNKHPYWFALFNEIVNNEYIYNIPIDDNDVSFFVNNPQFGTLYYTTNFGNKKEYPVPDIAYSGSSLTESKLYNTLGLPKTQGKYDYQFYFNTNITSIKGAESINRYAVFVDKSVSFTKQEIDKYINQLNKTIDDALMKYESIYIQDEPTLLILKEYNQHVPLTFYKI